MNINRKLILIAILAFVFSLFFVTATSTNNNATSTKNNDNDGIPVKQIVPLLTEVIKSGHNKLTVKVSWTGTEEAEDEKATSRLRCHPKSAVTVKNSPQKHVFGDQSTTYELAVHKKNTHVKCRTGITDIEQFIYTFSFRT